MIFGCLSPLGVFLGAPCSSTDAFDLGCPQAPGGVRVPPEHCGQFWGAPHPTEDDSGAPLTGVDEDVPLEVVTATERPAALLADEVLVDPQLEGAVLLDHHHLQGGGAAPSAPDPQPLVQGTPPLPPNPNLPF